MTVPNLIIFIVIILIILVIAYIIYSILIWHRTTKDPHFLDDPGSKFHVIDIHTAYFTEEECKESGICFSTTPIIPIARPLFKQKNRSSQYEFAANIAGAMELSNNEAIVMDVKIPSKPIVYCSITGYIYDIPNGRRRKVIYFPLGNISSLGLEKQCGKRIYAILTSNPSIAAKVAKKYESTGIVRVININENYCNPEFRFSLLGRVVHSKISRKDASSVEDSTSEVSTEVTVKNPTFRTRKIVFPGIEEHHFPAMYVPQREPEMTTELNIDEQQWQSAGSEIVSRLRGIQSYTRIPVNISGTMDFGSLPGNFDLPEADNHDMTIFRSDEIKVNPDEIILVVYVDHNKSGMGQFSTISFFDSDREFGYKSVPPEISKSQPGIRSYIHIPPQHVGSVVVKEMIFSEPRCHANSVHHMQVFVLKRT